MRRQTTQITNKLPCRPPSTGMLSYWRNFRHCLHCKLSLWQLSVETMTKISSKWWPVCLSDVVCLVLDTYIRLLKSYGVKSLFGSRSSAAIIMITHMMHYRCFVRGIHRQNGQLSFVIMMTSSNGNIFLTTGPLWGETTGLGVFLVLYLRVNKRLNTQLKGLWFESRWRSLWRHGNAISWH